MLCFSDTEDTEEDDSSDSDSDYGNYDDFLLDYYDGDNDTTTDGGVANATVTTAPAPSGRRKRSTTGSNT